MVGRGIELDGMRWNDMVVEPRVVLTVVSVCVCVYV